MRSRKRRATLGARKSARAIASAPLSSTAQSPRSSVRSAGAAARAAARARTESRARACPARVRVTTAREDVTARATRWTALARSVGRRTA